MIKTIIIPIVVSVLSLFSFLNSEVTLDLNMPEMANAGDEFLVEVTIQKGDIEGFARFEQSLPVGFKAIARETVNGKFQFVDQKVKIQWMRVPFDREFVISYAIQVDPTISGTFTFDGKFSYIENNAVKVVSAPEKMISIIGDEMAAGTAEQANTTYSYQNVNLKNIDCIRQKPYLNTNNEIIVNLMINKGNLQEFGKIQEQVPRGYRAESIKSKNSIFTFKSGIIKFLWMNMPRDEQFTVSYKLIEEGVIPEGQAFIITGTFSYAENDRTTTLNIAERNVDLANFAGEDLVAQTTETENTTENSNTATTDQLATNTYSETVTDNQDNTSTNTIETTDYTNTDTDITDNTTNNSKQTKTNTSSNFNNISAIANIPTPENGVGYRVQIAAGHNLVGEKYFRKLNITDEVQTEIHDGWHKYTIGNFNMYRDARDYRVYVWNNTPIHDAFVAAYNNGMRITVQEALMIANQKWYK
ncbi:MAG: hypothetical protein JEZ09_03460 [Salinivirgaceae bacterium]|nr:hypothetical protein [Salinivirgaceae bacterium]